MKQTIWNWYNHFPEGKLEELQNNQTEKRTDYLHSHYLNVHRVVCPEESQLMALNHHLFHHLRNGFVQYFGTEIAICSRLLLWERPERLL